MALEDTTAKYEINIVRTGDGASQASAALKDVEKSAASARHETEGAAGALHTLHESGLAGRDGLHAVHAAMEIAEGKAFSLTGAFMAVHGSLNVLRGSSAAFGVTLGAAGAALAALAAVAVATSIPFIKLNEIFEETAESEKRLDEQTAEMSQRLTERLAKLREAGLLSPQQMFDLSMATAPFASNDQVRGAARTLNQMGLSDQGIKALNDFRKLQAELHAETMDQFDAERARARIKYDEQIKQLEELKKVNSPIHPDDIDAAKLTAGQALSRASGEVDTKEKAKEAEDTIKEMELEISSWQANQSEVRQGIAQKEFEWRLAEYRKLLAGGVITEQQLSNKVIEANVKLQEQVKAENAAYYAQRERETMDQIKSFDDKWRITELENSQDRIGIAKEEFAAKQDLLNSLYIDHRLTYEKMTQLEDEAKIHELQAINSAEKRIQIHIQTIEEMTKAGVEGFAGGLSQAMVAFVSQSKNAQQAFGEFASQFLQQIAVMILQMSILNAIKSAGLFPGLFAASGGAGPIAAADGLSGLTSGPTYLPKFNVLAGEAGTEMLTVLARPRFMSLGGVEAIVGQAGNKSLAVTNASSLALGGAGGAGGKVVVEITHSEESKARIIEQSVAHAEVRITQRAKQNGPLREAIKTAAR